MPPGVVGSESREASLTRQVRGGRGRVRSPGFSRLRVASSARLDPGPRAPLRGS